MVTVIEISRIITSHQQDRIKFLREVGQKNGVALDRAYRPDFLEPKDVASLEKKKKRFDLLFKLAFPLSMLTVFAGAAAAMFAVASVSPILLLTATPYIMGAMIAGSFASGIGSPIIRQFADAKSGVIEKTLEKDTFTKKLWKAYQKEIGAKAIIRHIERKIKNEQAQEMNPQQSTGRVAEITNVEKLTSGLAILPAIENAVAIVSGKQAASPKAQVRAFSRLARVIESHGDKAARDLAVTTLLAARAPSKPELRS